MNVAPWFNVQCWTVSISEYVSVYCMCVCVCVGVCVCVDMSEGGAEVCLGFGMKIIVKYTCLYILYSNVSH